MLVITVELHSAIDGSVKHLGTAFLSNDGSGTETVGNYDLEIKGQGVKTTIGRAWKTGRVEGFNRKRDNCWKLLFYALGSMIQGKAKVL